MQGKLKSRLGFKPKARSSDEIRKDYNENAVAAGHKAGLINEATAEIERLEQEITDHLVAMRKIRFEATHIAPVAAPAPKPEEKGTEDEKKESA